MTRLVWTRTNAWLRNDRAVGSRIAPGTRRPSRSPLTTQRSRRLVSLAVLTATLVGATSGGACSVWMTREDGLAGLAPTTFTCLMRNLEAQQRRPSGGSGEGGARREPHHRLSGARARPPLVTWNLWPPAGCEGMDAPLRPRGMSRPLTCRVCGRGRPAAPPRPLTCSVCGRGRPAAPARRAAAPHL